MPRKINLSDNNKSESAVPKRVPKNVKPEVGAVVNVIVEPETV